MVARKSNDRVVVLLNALGIDPESFEKFLGWVLAEHLVAVLSREADIRTEGFFSQPNAMKLFREILHLRTGRKWSVSDLEAIYGRVKADHTRHFRDPIPYEEYLKLLWQVPWECARCHQSPPEVKLHVDHILPASRGGSSKRANLQFLCAFHNLKKSNQREVTGPWLDLR